MVAHVMCTKCKRMSPSLKGVSTAPCRRTKGEGTERRTDNLTKFLNRLAGDDKADTEYAISCLKEEVVPRNTPSGEMHGPDTDIGYVAAPNKASRKLVYCKACGRTANRPAGLKAIRCKALAPLSNLSQWEKDRRIKWVAENISQRTELVAHYAKYGNDKVATIMHAIWKQERGEAIEPGPKRLRMWAKGQDRWAVTNPPPEAHHDHNGGQGEDPKEEGTPDTPKGREASPQRGASPPSAQGKPEDECLIPALHVVQ